MASQSSISEEDFSCTVCLDIFKDPVVLLCSHSFCKGCLQTWWDEKKIKECPVCKIISSIDHPPRNLALKKLCEAFVQDRRQPAEKSGTCSSRPIAALDNKKKEDLQKSQETIQKKLKAFNAVRQKCVQTAAYIKVQARDTKRKIKEQFQKLHQFLQDEEEASISALMEEEEHKSHLMEEMLADLRDDISYISATSRAIDTQLRAAESVFQKSSFQQDDYKRMMVACKRLQSTSFDLPPGSLIDVAKHLGNLAYNAWDRMKDIVFFTSVILDPNTAYPEPIILSDDLTSLAGPSQSDYPYSYMPEVPDIPERMNRWNWVLGSAGFDSGYHSWDVEVGDGKFWELGVWQSFNRKGNVRGNVRGRFWGIASRDFSLAAITQGSHTKLAARAPWSIRVHLDYDKGNLWFTNLATNEHVYGSPLPLTDTLFPFFTSTRTALKILPGLCPCKYN